MKSIAPAALLCLFAAAALPGVALSEPGFRYDGPCDASAAVALDAEHFIVANDETNVLNVYRRGQAQAVGAVPLAKFLGTRADEESDIEGAASVGMRTYWITSHGRDGKGKAHESRHRFFATETTPGSPPSVKPVGRPYARLLADLERDDALEPYKLASAARLAAEAAGGLNIEGLAATPDGRLLIGFRNPLVQQRALIVPLENPGEVIQGRRARLGGPIELDLGGRGIRSIERVGTGYLIVAGPSADKGSFGLYRWSGRAGDAATLLTGVDLQDLRPEAMFAIPQSHSVQLLSDDGGVKVGGVRCKKLPPAQQSFRSLTITP